MVNTILAPGRLALIEERKAEPDVHHDPKGFSDRFALYDLLVAYGALIDAGEFDSWLGLFAERCTYHILPRENYERGLPAGLVFCDSRAVLEDRIGALREANKYNIHTDRHLIGLPRLIGEEGGEALVEAPFAVSVWSRLYVRVAGLPRQLDRLALNNQTWPAYVPSTLGNPLAL